MKAKRFLIVTFAFVLLLSLVAILFVACNGDSGQGGNSGGGDQGDGGDGGGIAKVYSIKFVVDGNTLQTVTYTDSANIQEPAVPSKTGYTGVWENYTPQLNNTQVVNAVYTAKTYTVTLDYGNATDGIGASTVTATFDQPIGKLPSPSTTGNEFQGWYYNGELVTETTLWTWDVSNATLTALFADTQGVTYSLNEDGKSYYVSNGGKATTNEVVLLSAYKGLPVTSIGYQAFSKCSSLTEITIPSSIIRINGGTVNKGAFDNCGNLQTVTFEGDSQLQSIGDLAFWGCISLTEITIPSTVTSIGEGAFCYCSSLQTITFEDNSQLQSIGNSAFSECISLTEITIPSTVTSIGEGAFV